MRSIAAVVSLSFAVVGCGLVGNGQRALEDRDVAAFDAVAASDALSATIAVDPDQPQAVQVSGDSNLVPLVRTTVSGHRLTIEIQDHTSFSSTLPLLVTVRTPSLVSIDSDDAASAIAIGASASLTAHVNDAASLDASSLRAAAVAITASNASSAHVCATASLDATASIASQIAYRCDPASITQSVDGTSTLTSE